MKLSRNEVAATLMKAARGQGLPHGHADVFVPAAIRAMAAHQGYAEQVTKALMGPHRCKETRVAMAGPLAIDALMCGETQVTLARLDCPEILFEMVGNIRNTNGLCVVVHVENDRLILSHSEEAVSHRATTGPIDIPADIFAQWQAWAAETYVPASTESRLGGAGAGLTDND